MDYENRKTITFIQAMWMVMLLVSCEVGHLQNALSVKGWCRAVDVDSSSSGRKAKKRFPKKVSPATFPSANFREIFLSNLVFGQQHSSKSLLVKNEKQKTKVKCQDWGGFIKEAPGSPRLCSASRIVMLCRAWDAKDVHSSCKQMVAQGKTRLWRTADHKIQRIDSSLENNPQSGA